MPQTNALFTAQDLTDLLQRPITDAQAAVAERVVWGWVKPLLKLEERPATLPDEITGAVLELGAGFVVNPEGLEEYQLENEISKYGAARRGELLDTITNNGTPGVPRPRGGFPPARRYPDPAERCWRS